MKRFYTALLALACLGLLTACQKTAGSAPEGYTGADIQAMVEAGAFSEELEELDGDVAFALYALETAGLTRKDMEQCTALRSAGATCEEAAVLAFATQEQAEKALQALEDYVEGQIDSNRDYRPAEIPKLEHALLEQRNSTVLLVVANDLDAAKSVLNQA